MLRKTSLILTFVVLIVCNVLAQDPENRDLQPFRKLYAEDRVIVRLVKADKESAVIQAQGIETSSVKTDVSDETLKISIYGEPFTRKKVMVTVNYVNIENVVVTGGADVTFTTMYKEPYLTIDLKSGGMLYLDADMGTLRGKLTEGSLLTAEGYAKKMDISVATAATISAFDFECDTVNIKVNSGGKAKINVEDVLNAEASSKGFISYKGDPANITRNAVSGSTIEAYKP